MTQPYGVTRVHVDIDPAYEVLIGPELLGNVDRWLPRTGARQAALITAGPVEGLYAPKVEAGLRAAGLDVHVHAVPDGETAKSLDVLGRLYAWLASIPLARGDLVIALGGGVVTDLAGFVAATWHRGVSVVQLPTTLLAQVDAAIGGKTGINLPAGKNLVGAFHQPLVVVADTAVLSTLPQRELRAGMAEVLKCGFIRDPAIVELIDDDPTGALRPTGDVLPQLVHRAVRVKAKVVAADTREHGERALLNYGHTFGHALEALTDYRRYRHGEAVGIGMRYVALVGEQMGVSRPGLAERTTELLTRLGLPTTCEPLDIDEVLATMGRDKKVRDGLRLVLCERPGVAHLASAPDRHVLTRALERVTGTG